MSFMLSSVYDSIDYNPCVEGYSNDYNSEVNQEVGYKWYQSSPSSDVLAASPCSCGCQMQFLQNPVGNLNLYYPVEYRPPEPPPLSSHSNSPDVTINPYYYPSHMFHDAEPPQSPNLPTTEFCAPYMYTPPFTLTCYTTLSSGQPYYALEFENPITTPCSTLTPMPSDKHECNGVIQISAVDVVNGDASNLVEKAVEVQKELVVDAVEVGPQVFDKSPVRNSALVDEHVCADDLSHDDASIWINMPIIQHSSSILQYIEEFVRVKSRVEFNFKCDFEDNFLAYCFVEGLQEEIREALELCAPQTLQEAIYLATFQELLLEEELLFEATKDGAAIGECQAILVKESFMVQANNKEVFIVVEKKYGGLNDELELQVERRVAVTTYVNEMFAEIFGVGKQAFVEDIHSVTLSNMEESVEAFVDMEETSFTVPVCVADPLKRLARNIDVSFSLTVMQIISPSRAFTIANDLDKWYIVNAGKKNLRNFDPGGGKIAASIFTTKVGILEFLLEDQGYARQRNVSDTTMAYDKMVKAGIEFNSVSWNGMLAEFNQNGHHLVQQLSLKLNEVLALRIANTGGLGCQILYYCSHMVVNLFMGRRLKEQELVEIGIMGKKREKCGVEGMNVGNSADLQIVDGDAKLWEVDHEEGEVGNGMLLQLLAIEWRGCFDQHLLENYWRKFLKLIADFLAPEKRKCLFTVPSVRKFLGSLLKLSDPGSKVPHLSIRESFEAKEVIPRTAIEEIEALFFSMYTSSSYVLYRSDIVAPSWFWNDITLVFDPGDIIKHFAVHLGNFLVNKGIETARAEPPIGSLHGPEGTPMQDNQPKPRYHHVKPVHHHVEGFDVLHKVYKFFCLLVMSSRSNAERFASSIANEFLTTIRKQFHNPDLKSGPYPGAPPNALLSKRLQQSSSHDVSVVGYVAPEYVHDYAWCRNDSVFVFDPGGNRIHFALHLKNILVCKDFQIFVLGNEESTYVLLGNSGQHIKTDVSHLPSDPIEMLYLLRLADDKRMLASLEQHILLHNTELVYGTTMDAATVEVPVHILIGSMENLVFEALREHWHVVNGMHQLVHYATSEDAWCGSDVKLVFDPGGCDCWLQRCVQGSHILEDKDILRVMDCNGPDKYYPTWTGLLFHLGHLTDLDYKPNPFLLKIAWL